MIFGKLIQESIAFATNALKENRLRTILSLSGISIGIFTIVAVFTVIGSLERSVQDSVKSFGEDVVYIQKWPWIMGGNVAWRKYASWPVPNEKELKKLSEKYRVRTYDLLNVSQMLYQLS